MSRRFFTHPAFCPTGYVLRVRLAFVEMDIYVVVPVDDILSARKFAVTMAALVIGFIFLLGGFLFCKVIRQHERIEDLFAREARRVEEDLSMARAIQANALPSVFPPYPNLRDAIDIHALMRPAREVGGDFYDFFFTGPGKLTLVIASVRAEREIGVVAVYRKVILDMTDVTYVTSAGIRALVGLRKRMAPDAKLELEGVQPFVRHILELSGLTALIGQ